jgi:hypothetical protein
MKTKIIDNVEYETELHTDMNYISKIKIPKGWRLLTITELLNLWNNYRNYFDFGKKDGVDEFIQQIFKDLKKKYPVANLWFNAPQYRSYLYCGNRSLYYDDYALGVRFCRDLKEKK